MSGATTQSLLSLPRLKSLTSRNSGSLLNDRNRRDVHPCISRKVVGQMTDQAEGTVGPTRTKKN
jgi:hypothetical protein